VRVSPRVLFVIAGLSLFLALVAGVASGPVPIGVAEVLLAWRAGEAAQTPAALILWEIRLPRVILAALVGSALAVSGAVLQGLLRNPLADPYLLGVSAGASFGATAVIVTGMIGMVWGVSVVPLAALAGALVAVWLVYQLARVNGKLPVFVLILAGVAVGYLLAAGVSLLIFWGQERMHQVIFWLMGGFAGRNWSHVTLCLPYLAVGLGLAFAWARELNLLLGGEETAAQLGVEVERVKLVLIFAAALLTAAAVAVGGLIGFVGLVVPHVVRILAGPDHRVLLPACALAGGAFLVAADVVARTIVAPVEVPLGIITALTGGPFFLYLLWRRKGGLFGQL
jgi:iron complex transport system permease protein